MDKVKYIYIALLTLLFTACLSESEGPQPIQMGRFALAFTADGLDVEVITRSPRELTAAEAADYRVTLTQGAETLWQSKKFSEISEADRTQVRGDGYCVSAENCTAAEAESANDGWGQKRYIGQSPLFSIVANEIQNVQVPCQMTNAGLCVVFDESFTNRFSDYAVTTDDMRALKFDANSADGTIAYYNIIDESDKRDLPLLITASAGWDGTVRLSRTIPLQRGKTLRLRVRFGEPEPETGSIGTILITYDDAFTPVGEVEILLE